ncbi:HNH endonuclease, partial [Phormidium sp. CCY1219]|nr:HNH endonuclease [Phormidium sp. CCY1219]
ELLNEILWSAKRPFKDAAAVNSTRWTLYRALSQTDLPVETGTGGRIKFNRSGQELTKTHWLDAACVGKSTP